MTTDPDFHALTLHFRAPQWGGGELASTFRDLVGDACGGYVGEPDNYAGIELLEPTDLTALDASGLPNVIVSHPSYETASEAAIGFLVAAGYGPDDADTTGAEIGDFAQTRLTQAFLLAPELMTHLSFLGSI